MDDFFVSLVRQHQEEPMNDEFASYRNSLCVSLCYFYEFQIQVPAISYSIYVGSNGALCRIRTQFIALADIAIGVQYTQKSSTRENRLLTNVFIKARKRVVLNFQD